MKTVQTDLAHTPVKDCMTTPVLSISPYDSLAYVFQQMTTHHVRRLAVLDHDKLAGIITWSDVLANEKPDPAARATAAEVMVTLERLTVGAVMSRDPVTVHPNDVVGYAASLMLDNKVGGLPVIDANGVLVGMITESNIFGLLAARWQADNARFSGAKTP